MIPPYLNGRYGLLNAAWAPTPATRAAMQYNTNNCTLFKLPAEIRNRIYYFVLGGNHIEIQGRYNGTISSTVHNTPNPWIQHHRSYLHRHLRKDITQRTKYSLTLLRVCRQIYSESCLMPYSHNVFSFQDKGTLNCLFLKKLRAIQKRSVREIAVEWKPTSAAQVKDLTGLKTVYYFEDPYFTKWRELRIWERGWGSGGMDWENVVKDVKVINAGEFDWDCKESPFWEEFVWDGIEVGDVDETLRPRLGP